jgi:hypothetical protein
MAIADIVRRGYAATIGKVVTRGYTPVEFPGGSRVSVRGSRSRTRVRGSSR